MVGDINLDMTKAGAKGWIEIVKYLGGAGISIIAIPSLVALWLGSEAIQAWRDITGIPGEFYDNVEEFVRVEGEKATKITNKLASSASGLSSGILAAGATLAASIPTAAATANEIYKNAKEIKIGSIFKR